MSIRLPAAAAVALACVGSIACGQKPAALQVSPPKVKFIGLERPQRLVVRVLDAKGQPMTNAPAVAWSSSKPAVAEVDGSGRVLSKKEGKAVVTAKLESLSAQVSVEVLDVKAIELTPTAVRLVGGPGIGIPLQAIVRDSHDAATSIPVTWSSSDERVATVSPDGFVTAVSAGKTSVFAKIGDVQSGAEVIVDARSVGRIVLLPATALVHVGDSQHYQVLVYGSDGKEIDGASARFQSSNPDVVAVDPAGVATGRRNGAATVRAQVGTASAESTMIVN